MKVSSDIVDQIIESSKWATLGLKVDTSKKEVVKEEKKEEKKEVIKEGKEQKVEKHVCPLCESELKEPLSEDQILEHASNMLEVFEAVEEAAAEMLNEEDEDLDEEDAETEDSEEDTDEDEEDTDEDDE